MIADGSIAGVMDGRRYNRAVRLHKLVYEAFKIMYYLSTTHPDAHAEFKQGGFSAWLQQPLRKNPCRSKNRRNGEQGHPDATRDHGVQFEIRGCEQILLDHRV